MAYEKTEWKNGDIITDEKLNHMEDGIVNSNSILVLHENAGALDKTFAEIEDAFDSGKLILVYLPNNNGRRFVTMVVCVDTFGGNYYLFTTSDGSTELTSYNAVTENSYPTNISI